ncbi:putative reverse transcriptase domain-containing protein [Tanacetum coccineum]
MTSITSVWPFSQWGIDIVGPLPIAPGGARFLVVAIDYFTKWVEAKSLISATGKHMESSLIPLSRGSFDVIVGMDWLSKRKFVIVCHEKVVRIPLEGDELLQIHGERTQGVMKTLMNTKFRIDIVHGATSVAKSPYHLAPLEMQELSEQLRELQDKGKANVVTDALSRKEQVKPRRVRAMAMTIQYVVRGMILTAQSEAFKQENVSLVGSEMDEAHGARLVKEIEIDDLPRGFGRQIGESSLTGPELVLDTTDKVVLTKEKIKAVRDRQKSYADNRRKPLEFEVGDRVMLKVSPWKGVIRFGKKGKLAPRFVGPFEILERIGPVAYRLKLPEELSGVHDTFHVSNLKKCLADASLRVPLDEIKVDKTLRFVEKPVEIMDREVKRLKHSRIPLVKVHWNSKRGPEFTWELEDHTKSKYPQLFIDRDDESAS